MTQNIYIVGDSFCHWRTSTDHWPVRLANKLDLSLTGNGYPGLSWWHTREDLIKYMKTPAFEDTKYFVIVHTDFMNRILSREMMFTHQDDSTVKLVREVYIKYLQDQYINEWIMKSWFLELNTLLLGKNVIHIQAFPEIDKYVKLLSGLKLVTPLIDLSLQEIGFVRNKFLYDSRHNHFSPENNKKLADVIFENIEKYFNSESTIDLITFNL